MLEALRQRIDGGERITAVRPLTAGHSNQTYLLEGLDRVLQAEPRGPALMRTYDVARLHAIYTGVGRQAGGPPVPERAISSTKEDVEWAKTRAKTARQ